MIGKRSGRKKDDPILNTSEAWHKRYLEQAQWTEDLRRHLIKKSRISKGSRILDVGCGTGALIAEFEDRGVQYYGVDLSFSSLHYAKRMNTDKGLLQGDALTLPFSDNIFDLAFCHFLLMWVSDPGIVVREMTRVAKPGGSVIAFAEPDYGGRIDYPSALEVLGKYQITALTQQGANPFLGRELAKFFQDAELSSIQTGVLGGEWPEVPNWKAWQSEWLVLESDISKIESASFSIEIEKLKGIDRQAYENGYRILYVPTFYAIGVEK